MVWTRKHIEQLKQDGKIRGFSDKKYSAKTAKNIPPQKSKALIWLDLNILYWCNERLLSLEKEYQFDPERKWRFDYCIPAHKIYIEYEGGIYLAKSGHNTAKGYTKDTEKYNAATVQGWRGIRVTASNYKTVLDQLNRLIS